MDDQLRASIERYKRIDWNSLTKEDLFAEGKNFKSQQKFFLQAKATIDTILDNMDLILDNLPDTATQQIRNQIEQIVSLSERIRNYKNLDEHGNFVQDIKRTCFEIQETLSKYISYVKPSDYEGKIKEKLDEISQTKDSFDKAVESVKELSHETEKIQQTVSEQLKEVTQGIQKVSEDKREFSGQKEAGYYEEQAMQHRNNAEGDGSRLFWKILNSRGWLGSRNVSYFSIIGIILIMGALYIATFLSMDVDRWKSLWDARTSILFVALLSVLYTGLYFATKNYEREKDLEYRNKARANIAHTALLFAAGQDAVGQNIVVTEASKTLFSDIVVNNKGKSTENKSVNISIPQNIGKNLNDE